MVHKLFEQLVQLLFADQIKIDDLPPKLLHENEKLLLMKIARAVEARVHLLADILQACCPQHSRQTPPDSRILAIARVNGFEGYE